VHVSRPGPHPDQAAALRRCRDRQPGFAVRAPFARPRHRVRHRRDRARRSVESHRGAASGRENCIRRARCRRVRAMTGPIDALPPLRDFIRRHRLSARKSLGQNFLLDLNLAARIARGAGRLEGVTVIEIGPGPGGLTRALLALGAEQVVAVERDPRSVAALAEIVPHFAGRLTVVEADAMRFDAKPYLGRGPTRVVGNLPFNIATALLVAWLSAEPLPPFYDPLGLTFHRDIA